MCLAVPGKILSVTQEDTLFRHGRVDFGGVVKDVNLAYVSDALVGDYVIVHAGVALNKVNEDEAVHVSQFLKELNELEFTSKEDAEYV